MKNNSAQADRKERGNGRDINWQRERESNTPPLCQHTGSLKRASQPFVPSVICPFPRSWISNNNKLLFKSTQNIEIPLSIKFVFREAVT